jgi:hypothetical protein
MKRTTNLISLIFLLALSTGTFAQRYNAGVNSGTAGNYNTYVGPYAGQHNGATNNTFLGTAAGQFSTGGSNTYLGFFAGYWNSSIRNTMVGYNAGARQFSTGSNNTFLGYSTGVTNLDGEFNTFLGSEAGRSNSSGSYNTLVGMGAGQRNDVGHHNTFLGNASGNWNTSGSENLFLGANAGMLNGIGYRNSFLGTNAGFNNTGGAENVFVGFVAGRENKGGHVNTFLGTAAGHNNTEGHNNVFLGSRAGLNNLTGSGNTLVGNFAAVNSGALTNAAAIGFQARVSVSNALVLGSVGGQNGATVSARVGIGTTAPAYRLHLNSSRAAKVGGGSWIVASDQRLKKDIQAFTDGLNVLLHIKPVTFRYNGKAGIDTDKQFVGVLAQDMQQVAPYTVGQFTYQDSTGKQEQYLDYDPNAVTYVLVNAAKELNAENEALRASNDQLQARLGNLEGQVARLEQLVRKDSPENPSAARLYQNQPNPYGEKTVIRYFLPQTTSSARLKVFSATGIEVYSRELTGKGAGEVELSGHPFGSGTYVYQLVVDGRVIDSKKLVLTR